MASIFRKGLFDGHVAIVTGGGSGIGLAIARSLGELGAKVAIAAATRSASSGQRPSSGRTAASVLAAPCDIREAEQVAALVDAVVREPRARDDPRQQRRRPVPDRGRDALAAGLGRGHPQQPERHVLHDPGGRDEAR